MQKGKGYSIFRSIIQWGSLVAFILCVLVILIESAIPGDQSKEQSDGVANIVQDGIDSDYDEENLKDIESFDVVLEKTEGVLVGETLSYEIHYQPEDTSYPSLSWNISDPSAFDIDYTKQTIECLKEGSFSFEIVSQRNKELTDRFTLQVDAIPVEEIRLPYESITLEVNQTLKLKPTVLPENATYKEVSFSSADPSIAGIEEDGVVTAKKAGKTTITVASQKYPDISLSVPVLVELPGGKPIATLSLMPLSLYAKQDGVLLQGSYGPIGSAFDMKSLRLETANPDVVFSNPKANASSATFSFRVAYEKDVEEKTLVPIKAIYTLPDVKEIQAETTLEILPRMRITADMVDTSRIPENYEGTLYRLANYGEKAPLASRNLTIEIPLSEEVTLKILSKDYHRITLAPVNPTDAFDGKITYGIPGETPIVLPFSYLVKDDSSYIQEIQMRDLYAIDEKKENVLLAGEEYETILSHELITSSGNASFVFADTGLRYEILEGKEAVSFLEKGGRPVGLKALKAGRCTIRAYSEYEEAVGVQDPVSVTFEITVVDTPSSARLLSGNKELDPGKELVLKKNQKEVLEYEGLFTPQAKTELSAVPIAIPYTTTITDESVLSYSKASKTFTALKGGKTTVTFLPEDPCLAHLAITIDILVDHVEIDMTQFAFHIRPVEYPEGNVPDDGFSMVALGTRFQLNASVNADASIPNLAYSSSDPSILEVDENTGDVQAKGVGKATLTCYSLDDPTKRIEKTIEVVAVSSPFTLDTKTLNPMSFKEVQKDPKYGNYLDIQLRYGTSYSLELNLASYATSNSIRFAFVDPTGTKSLEDVLAIDEQGKISLLKTGTTWLQVTYGEDTLSPQVAYYRITSVRDTVFTFRERAKILRKLIGHLLLFAGTAFFAMHFIALFFHDFKRRVIASGFALVTGFAVAGFSELIQVYTPGRGPTWQDVGIDFAGFAITVVFFLLLFVLIYFLKERRRKDLSSRVKILTHKLDDSSKTK